MRGRSACLLSGDLGCRRGRDLVVREKETEHKERWWMEARWRRGMQRFNEEGERLNWLMARAEDVTWSKVPVAVSPETPYSIGVALGRAASWTALHFHHNRGTRAQHSPQSPPPFPFSFVFSPHVCTIISTSVSACWSFCIALQNLPSVPSPGSILLAAMRTNLLCPFLELIHVRLS